MRVGVGVTKPAKGPTYACQPNRALTCASITFLGDFTNRLLNYARHALSSTHTTSSPLPEPVGIQFETSHSLSISKPPSHSFARLFSMKQPPRGNRIEVMFKKRAPIFDLLSIGFEGNFVSGYNDATIVLLLLSITLRVWSPQIESMTSGRWISEPDICVVSQALLH